MNTLEPVKITSASDIPDIALLTTQSLEGTGVFDVLMKVVKLHLMEEYTENRIVGEEYTQLYLNSLQTVMQQSLQFILNNESAKQINAEIGLIRQKIVTELANTDDSIPMNLGFNDSTAIEGLIASKLALETKQSTLIDHQISAAEKESSLIGQKIISELSRTDHNITAARAAGFGYNTADTAGGDMTAIVDRRQAEADLAEQKVVTELAQTSNIKPAELGKDPGTVIGGLVKANTDLTVNQAGKAANEIILLAQKTITELAQTSDTVPTNTDALNTSSVVAGSVGKQKNLYAAQTDGFARDAEQKLLRIMADAWAVDATTGDATANATNKLDDANLGAVVTKAKAGVGL